MLKATLLVAILLVVGCQARLPKDFSESKEAQPSMESAPVNPNESSSPESEEGTDMSSFFPRTNEQEQFDKMLRETLNMFDAFRSNLWNSRIHNFHHHHGFPSSVPSMEDDSTAGNPFSFMVRPPIFIRDPSFSFFDRQPSFNPFQRRPNPMNPIVPNFQNQIPSGYSKVNETRTVIDGKEICQTVYEKVQQSAGNYFQSRITTVQPCEQVTNSKRDNEPTEGNKKDQDVDSVKPGVERETDPKEVKPEGSDLAPVSTEAPKEILATSSTTAVPEEESSSKPETESKAKPEVEPTDESKKTSSENEILDKAAEPSISVSDK